MKGKKLILTITAIVLVVALGVSAVFIYDAFRPADEKKSPSAAETPEEQKTEKEKVLTYAEQVEEIKKELDSIKELNGGVLPVIALDSQTSAPNFILGTYSNKTVSSGSDAQSSLKDVQYLMGIQNVNKEYKESATLDFGGTKQYRLQQMFGEYQVYGQQLVVTTDANGKVTSLSGDYVTVGSLFDSEIMLSQADALAKVAEAGYTVPAETPATLVAYTLNGYNEMAYVVELDAYTVVVSAKTGDILSVETKIVTALPSDVDSDNAGTVTSTIGRDETNSSDNTFNTAWYDYVSGSKTDTFIFYDTERDIVYHDLGMYVKTDWYDLASTLPLQDSDNIWTSEAARKAIVLYRNLANTYDFYLNVLGLMSYDGNGGQILAFVNDGYDFGYNAYNWGPGLEDFNSQDGVPAQNVTILSFGGSANYQNELGVVAHEFTHALQGARVAGIQYMGQTGALMEAYSDVMGELVEAYYGYADWVNGDRNMTNPGSVYSSSMRMNYPKKLNGAGFYIGSGDNGGVHHNSTVISHAMYKLYNSGLLNVTTMTELLYRSWGHLTSTATFYDYRLAMLASAQEMGLGEDVIAQINKVFDDADITIYNVPEDYDAYIRESAEIQWHIQSALDGTAIVGAEIVVNTVASNPAEVAKLATDESGDATLKLKPGVYSIKVTASGFLAEENVQILAVNEVAQITYRMQTEGSDSDEEIVCELGGVVTDALNGQRLPDVTMLFRKGTNITSGSVELTLTSDWEGKFYTDELDYGYYTVELQKDGYITSYIVVQAAASNWEEAVREDALNQSYSISPQLQVDDALRIVLTWGETPSDLDSHISGPTASGSSFHVYWSNKTAYDGSERVAILDVDDTSSYGPETVTLTPVTDGIYHYCIHDYSNRSNSSNTALASSGATIQVFSGSRLIATYNVPTDGIGTVWHVFDYDTVAGELIPVNTFGNEIIY